MGFKSRFSIGSIVDFNGVDCRVEAVRFTDSKVWYDIELPNGSVIRDVDAGNFE